MSWAVFFAALASACLHASWNVIAKMQRVPSEVVLGILLATAVVYLVALPLIGVPPAPAWPWLIVAAICNVIYSRALMAAYDLAALNLAYSVVRAMLPPMLFVLGYLFFAETIGVLAVLGLSLVVAALVLFGLQGRASTGTEARGILLAGFAGFAAAFSYACDIKGARLSGSGLLTILQYGSASSLTTAAGLLAVSLAEGKRPVAILQRNWRACASGALLLTTSYLTALWAYTQGPVGLVAPVRETSILFGGVMAYVVLKERIGPRQWVAIGLAAVGAALIKIK